MTSAELLLYQCPMSLALLQPPGSDVLIRACIPADIDDLWQMSLEDDLKACIVLAHICT